MIKAIQTLYLSVCKLVPFSKKEFWGISIILVSLLILTYYNFGLSRRNERDFRRNQDLGNIAKALENYKLDYGVYPLSDGQGRVIACRDENTNIKLDDLMQAVYMGDAKKPILDNLVACQWGSDSLMDVLDENYPHYLDPLPADPKGDFGYSYIYQSDGITYHVYTAYEGKSTVDYSSKIKSEKILCGIKYCSGGRATRGVILE